MRYLVEELQLTPPVQVDLEVKVPEVRRQADVLVTFPMGWRIAHEIQLASLTTEELQQRTTDYARAGIDTIWWLGGSADTPANRAWCVAQYGICYHIEFSPVVARQTVYHTDG